MPLMHPHILVDVMHVLLGKDPRRLLAVPVNCHEAGHVLAFCRIPDLRISWFPPNSACSEFTAGPPKHRLMLAKMFRGSTLKGNEVSSVDTGGMGSIQIHPDPYQTHWT